MTPNPAQQRWLTALLGAVFLLDLLLIAAASPEEYTFTLPGSAAMLACVYFAQSRPGAAAFAGALALVGSSVLIRQAGVAPLWVGIEHLQLSEVLAGGALVVLLVWRAQPGVAVVGTAALVIACLAAVGIRDGRLLDLGSTGPFQTVPGALDLRSLIFGFFMLMVCVGAGTYLRLSGEERVDSELRALVRGQWPLGAALTVLFLIDLGAAGGSLRSEFGRTYLPMHLLALVAGVVAVVCAFFAPRAPVRFALIGAGAIALVMVPMVMLGLAGAGSTGLTFSLTQVAASMALIAFVTRQAKPVPAAWTTIALVAANATALVDVNRHRLDPDLVLPVGFLLVVSVATGLYFRARDRERNQSVRVAVSGAQSAERLALARELHDVVAHHVTGIVVQAQAARLVADQDPMVAVGALEKIENSGAEALTAMRMLVGSLRGAEPAGGSTAATQATSDLAADIRALVDQFPGPTVHLELSLPDQLPHEMGRSVLRLVQESLTNVSKHAAGATTVEVGVSTGRGDMGDELHVFVRDDGTARRSHPAGGSGGYGLIGMRERVELLGGWFGAGPSSEGGWVVKVALPLRSKR